MSLRVPLDLVLKPEAFVDLYADEIAEAEAEGGEPVSWEAFLAEHIETIISDELNGRQSSIFYSIERRSG